MLKALLLTQNIISIMTIPDLLSRAGFIVDCISTTKLKKDQESVSKFISVADGDELIETATKILRDNYHLVVIGEDDLLKKILNANLSDDVKLKLLPIIAIKNFRHIYSKIGLSTVLKEHGVSTPEFLIVNEKSELRVSAEVIGYPVFLKIDSSGGGSGVYECSNDRDIDDLSDQLKTYPVLMQRKIQGTLLDLSGFYQNGRLIHFSYSYPKKFVTNKLAPSSVRMYLQLAAVEKTVFDELARLGKALGAHGFTNTTCIHSNQDQKLYFFEADMRPNVWVDFTKYFGDDSAIRIAEYFTSGRVLEYPCRPNNKYPEKILLPHFFRIKLWELIVNRYSAWKYIPKNNPIALYLIFKKTKGYIKKRLKKLLISSSSKRNSD
jgi:hypothetical protein